jgi:hypothetical protein
MVKDTPFKPLLQAQLLLLTARAAFWGGRALYTAISPQVHRTALGPQSLPIFQSVNTEPPAAETFIHTNA